jgi:hypothetical protein
LPAVRSPVAQRHEQVFESGSLSIWYRMKSGAELPGEAEGEVPVGGEPHAGVVVEIAGCDEFMDGGVEASNAGAARLGSGRVVDRPQGRQGGDVIGSNRGAMLEPTPEVACHATAATNFVARQNPCAPIACAIASGSLTSVRRRDGEDPATASWRRGAAVEVMPGGIGAAHPGAKAASRRGPSARVGEASETVFIVGTYSAGLVRDPWLFSGCGGERVSRLGDCEASR